MAIYVMNLTDAPADIEKICAAVAEETGARVDVRLKIMATITTEDPQARFELGNLLDPEPISIEEAAERG